jgi:hypothetical protein
VKIPISKELRYSYQRDICFGDSQSNWRCDAMMKETPNQTKDWLLKGNLSGATCTIESRTATKWKDLVNLEVGTSWNYTEPRQGTCNDCYFIAALISVAWAANNLLKTFPNYIFYNTITKSWSPSFSINRDLAVTNLDQLVYARTSSNKIWPCLYEKAYAMWRNEDLTNNHPSMSTVCGGGNGLTALQQITGKPLGPANTMPTFLPNGNTKWPTVAQTNTSPSHTYSVLRKISSTSYSFYNPCGGTTETVSTTDLPKRFSEWGYVKTS